LGGYPLGFWFAHQGSIYIFIVLIFWYAKKIGGLACLLFSGIFVYIMQYTLMHG